jgi:hypothetical protein
MNLQEQLNAVKAKFEATAPKNAIAIMHRAIDELRNSGILEHTLKVGDTAPDFTLKNAEGKIISSKELLTKGPLILSFYRGKW